MITLDDYLTTSGRHPERMRWVSPAVEQNAEELIRRVNALLTLFGQSRKVSGGFRDMLSNKSTPGASPFSRHQTGEAVDLQDATGDLDKWCLAHPESLEKFGLWAEPSSMTVGWTHLQTVAVPSGLRASA